MFAMMKNQIVSLIFERRHVLDSADLKGFIEENRRYYERTRQRMISYWSCYYRDAWPVRNEYVGFRLFQYFDEVRGMPPNIPFDTDASRRST